jgi:hypothetical protein
MAFRHESTLLHVTASRAMPDFAAMRQGVSKEVTIVEFSHASRLNRRSVSIRDRQLDEAEI